MRARAQSARGARRHRLHPVALLVALCLLDAWGVGRGPATAGSSGVPGLDPPDCVCVGRGGTRFPPPAPGDTLRLPNRLIAPSSLRVTDGHTQYSPDVHYRLDPLEGRIVWLGPQTPDSTGLLVTYAYLPFAVRGAWGGRAVELPETLAVPALLPAPERELPAGASLAIGGSKTFGLEFGTRRDAKLTQSLDLTIRGQLAPQVQVRAVLTDRSTPLQPEGTTAELEDLDQVLIEVTSPWGEMRLGDVEVQQSALQFAAHQRAMEGLRVRAGRARGPQGTGAVGRGLGRAVSLEFFGTEGKQGPYRLLERLPGEDAVIVAGSERVWLDGTRLRRGEDADYTIDYASGEFWFTPRRVVRAVSEIRIECQVREGIFDRTYYAFTGAMGDSAGGAAFAWMREGDDPDRSLGVALTDAERESLRRAGDARDTIVGGVRADTLGDYALVETDSVQVPFYLYIAEAPDPGAYGMRYAVAFADLGAGRGDYEASVSPLGRMFYRYVGHRRGRFVPGRRLPVPEARDLLAVCTAGRLGAGLAIAAEAAVSRHDRNLLSPRDDADNHGAALALNGTWQLARLWGGRPDAIELRVRGRDVQERFSSAERLDPSFYYRHWNASADSALDGHDRRGAAGLTCRPQRDVRLETEWEALRSVRGFDGRRWRIAAERRGRVLARGELWRTRTTEGDRPGEGDRRRLTLGWASATTAEATFESEALRRGRALQERGERFDALSVRMGSSHWAEGLTVDLLGEFRRDWERQAGVERRSSDRRLYQTDLGYVGGGALAHLLYSHRTSREAASGQTGTTDLADWSIARPDPDTRVTGEWRGRLTVEENRVRVERLQRVAATEGHYDSLGRYVGRGDYELYFQPGDGSALETRLETAARGEARPFSGSSRVYLAGLEATLFARVAATTPEPPAWLLGSLRRWFSGVTAVREHDRVLRGELAWVGPTRAPSLRLRLEGRRGAERSITGFARRHDAQARALEVRWTLRESLRTGLDLSHDAEREGVESSSGAAFDERRVWKLGLEAAWSPIRHLLLRPRGEGGWERYPPGAQRPRGKASLGVTLEPYRASRVEVVWERRWAGRGTVPSGPFWVEKAGWGLTANASVQPRPGLSLTLWLRADREPGRDTVVSGRMDARAYF